MLILELGATHGPVLLLELPTPLPLLSLDALPLLQRQHFLVLDAELTSLQLVVVEGLDDLCRLLRRREVGECQTPENAIIEVVVEGVWKWEVQVIHHIHQLLLLDCERDVLDYDRRGNKLVLRVWRHVLVGPHWLMVHHRWTHHAKAVQAVHLGSARVKPHLEVSASAWRFEKAAYSRQVAPTGGRGFHSPTDIAKCGERVGAAKGVGVPGLGSSEVEAVGRPGRVLESGVHTIVSARVVARGRVLGGEGGAVHLAVDVELARRLSVKSLLLVLWLSERCRRRARERLIVEVLLVAVVHDEPGACRSASPTWYWAVWKATSSVARLVRCASRWAVVPGCATQVSGRSRSSATQSSTLHGADGGSGADGGIFLRI